MGNIMSNEYSKWVAMWGNAMSITERRPESYAKDITLKYSIFCPFNGNKIRLTFDNYCGTDDVTIEKTIISYNSSFIPVTFSGKTQAYMQAGKSIVSDEIEVEIKAHKTPLEVSFYLKDFTQMRSGVYIQGPLTKGLFAVGDHTSEKDIDINVSRKNNIVYFLSNVSIYTEEQNKAVVCYGDSITAQDWPEILQQKLIESGNNNISIIRRATSGSRILREYSCITYESYGLMGTHRFEHEIPTDGADTVIIQQGINDIIHPVGTNVNPFRPMSDLPTADELAAGMDWYIQAGKKMGYKVYLGTLLPIEGWRTYADFREDLKNQFNQYLKNNAQADGCIDFAAAVCDIQNLKAFEKTCDSGDHLHPSYTGYEKMAETALTALKI